jgi:hypothetical protein
MSIHVRLSLTILAVAAQAAVGKTFPTSTCSFRCALAFVHDRSHADRR